MMKDRLIETFVNMAESGNTVDCKLTLMVGGSLLCGKVISHAEYMEQNHITKELHGIYLEHAASTGDDFKASPEFVHLRDAQFFISNGRPVPFNGSVFIRVRFEDICAFSFGDLEYSE